MAAVRNAPVHAPDGERFAQGSRIRVSTGTTGGFDGKRVSVGLFIPSKPEAAWLAQQMRDALGGR